MNVKSSTMLFVFNIWQQFTTLRAKCQHHERGTLGTWYAFRKNFDLEKYAMIKLTESKNVEEYHEK